MWKSDNPDLTLGRASVLLALCLFPERPNSLLERGDALYTSLVEKLENDPPIGTQPDEYLGIAHGWAGLLYACLRWANLRGLTPPECIRTRLQQLAARATFTKAGARWPVQSSSGSITMSGWCNGSAGHAFLWTLAHKTYSEPQYLELAERAAMDAYETSGGGHALCCGFAGQAYAQLSLYKHTGEACWLDRARLLGAKAAALGNTLLVHSNETLPHSLYKGDVGIAVLLADLERPESAAMPFFEE